MTATSDGIPPLTCSNPDCRVAETGRCVEALPFSDCSYYRRQPDAESALSDVELEVVQEAGIPLPGAGTLTPVDASEVLRGGEARVIAVIGPSDAGKTSLIASLYDMLLNGPVNGLDFARSRTLHAFEQTCHDARSCLPTRNTTQSSHTPWRGAVLSPRTWGEPLKHPVALLLADRAGENYRSAADDIASVEAFLEVKRADSLAVL